MNITETYAPPRRVEAYIYGKKRIDGEWITGCMLDFKAGFHSRREAEDWVEKRFINMDKDFAVPERFEVAMI